jgi:glyoxylase-like metal-dependent hydrolase (beta-lactamase superfamily II)
MKVHHLDCGTMCPVAGRFLIGGTELVCHVLAIETARDGVVLVDTGFGLRDCEDPRRLPRPFTAIVRPRLDRAQTAASQLRQLGFSPDDVQHVVITHLDLDHAGGLSDFPRAAIHLHRQEYVVASERKTTGDRIRYLQHLWSHAPRWVTYAPEGDTWMGLPAVRQLDGIRDEIALVPLIGHSRGHSGVALHNGDRWLMHSGDAIFHREELLGGRVPAGLRAFATMDEVDRKARLASVQALRDLSRRPDVDVINSHDPVLLTTAAARSSAAARAAG